MGELPGMGDDAKILPVHCVDGILQQDSLLQWSYNEVKWFPCMCSEAKQSSHHYIRLQQPEDNLIWGVPFLQSSLPKQHKILAH